MNDHGDENSQVGRIQQLTTDPPKRLVPRFPLNKTEEFDMNRKDIIPDPWTGQGDCREVPYLGSVTNALAEDNGSDGRAENQKDHLEQLGDSEHGGLRFNAGKLRMDLTPPEWEWALADVTTQGSKKYEERNWEKGMRWSSMIGCMKRHLNKFLAGERYDGLEFNKELGTTGCHHLAMVAWNALALMSYDLRKIGENNLPNLQLELFEDVNATTSSRNNTIFEDNN